MASVALRMRRSPSFGEPEIRLKPAEVSAVRRAACGASSATRRVLGKLPPLTVAAFRFSFRGGGEGVRSEAPRVRAPVDRALHMRPVRGGRAELLIAPHVVVAGRGQVLRGGRGGDVAVQRGMGFADVLHLLEDLRDDVAAVVFAVVNTTKSAIVAGSLGAIQGVLAFRGPHLLVAGRSI